MNKLTASIIDASKIGEDKRNFLAKNLSIISIALIIVLSLISIVGIFTPYLAEGSQYINIPSAFLFYVIYSIHKRGHHTLAGILTVFLLYVITIFNMIYASGIMDEVMLVIPVIMIFSSLTLSRFIFIIISVLSIFGVVIIGFAQIHGLLVTDTSSLINYGVIFSVYIILFCTAFLFHILSNSLFDLSKTISESAHNFKSVFHSNPLGIVIIGVTGKIVDANTPAINFLSSKKTLLTGKNLNEFVSEIDRGKLHSTINKIISKNMDGDAINLNIVSQKSGVKKTLINLIPILSKNNDPIAISVFFGKVS